MSLYYLMSQLPSLDGLSDQAPLPIEEERFLELCDRLLDPRTAEEVRELTLQPDPMAGDRGVSLVDAWNAAERTLRQTLAGIRAGKRKRSSGTEVLATPMAQVSRTAADMENPLEAERYLNQYRLDFLETLRPLDPFSKDAVYYYGIKLKLLSRMRTFDADKGRAAYRNIYDSILNGERLEVMQ